MKTNRPCDVAGFESSSPDRLDEEAVVLARGDDAGGLHILSEIRRRACVTLDVVNRRRA